jgi:hypothetical protein
MKLGKLLNEVSLTPKAAKFLDAIQIHDRGIKDLKHITVDASPQGNWSVYYKNKRLGTINARLLDDETIRKYGLEHMDHSYFKKHESVNEVESPRGDAQVIKVLNDIVKNHSALKIKDQKTGKVMMVDVQSANAVLKTYDALSSTNKPKYINSGMKKMIDFAWEVMRK